MFAIGFALFFAAILLDEVFDPFSNRHSLYAGIGVLGLFLMLAALFIWLWRVMP